MGQRIPWKAPLQLVHEIRKICLSKYAPKLSISEKRLCHYPLFPAVSNTFWNTPSKNYLRSSPASYAVTKSCTEVTTHVPQIVPLIAVVKQGNLERKEEQR